MTQRAIARAVTEALKEAPLLPRDAAAVALVKRYAVLLDAADGPEVIADVGPKLLTALTSLGMTPAGRGAKGGTSDVGPVATKLDELRARRQQRSG